MNELLVEIAKFRKIIWILGWLSLAHLVSFLLIDRWDLAIYPLIAALAFICSFGTARRIEVMHIKGHFNMNNLG